MDAPSVPYRRRKTAKERRQQQLRSQTRTVEKLLAGFQQLQSHRGCAVTKLGSALVLALAPQATTEVQTSPASVTPAEVPGSGPLQPTLRQLLQQFPLPTVALSDSVPASDLEEVLSHKSAASSVVAQPDTTLEATQSLEADSKEVLSRESGASLESLESLSSKLQKVNKDIVLVVADIRHERQFPSLPVSLLPELHQRHRLLLQELDVVKERIVLGDFI